MADHPQMVVTFVSGVSANATELVAAARTSSLCSSGMAERVLLRHDEESFREPLVRGFPRKQFGVGFHFQNQRLAKVGCEVS